MPASLQFWVDQHQDPKGARLREVLEAQFEFERAQAVGLMLVHALVPIGLVVWIAAVRPGLLPSWATELGEIGWGTGLIGLIIVVVRGRACGRRARRLAAESMPPDARPSGNEPD